GRLLCGEREELVVREGSGFRPPLSIGQVIIFDAVFEDDDDEIGIGCSNIRTLVPEGSGGWLVPLP
ncbi:unnamed protein product, partial [Amoebophrya sp. A25]